MIGSTLQDRYRLDAELGRGGLGIVFRGFDALLERPVAVKVLVSASLDSQARGRLLHEARAAARLKHPNIVSVYDAGEAGDLAFIVMELIEGQSLFERRPTELREIISIVHQVSEALGHAHAHGIIHRDLKLENVMVGPDGKATLTDFGLARSGTSRLTTEGTIIGTVFYLPPEQVLGQEVDGRADLYSLGVMLYELVTERLPFTGSDPLAVISQHLHAPPVPPSTYRPDIPPALEALILRLMSKAAQDRPASAAEVSHALAALLAPAGAPSEPNSAGEDQDQSLDRLVRGRLVGRSSELADMRALWKQTQAGTSSQPVLLVSGESGVGKTPLVRELMVLAQVSGGWVLSGDCYEQGAAPYSPVASIIRDALELLGERAHVPTSVLADLLTLAPDLRARYPELAANPPSDPQSEQQRLFESFLALCMDLVSSKPGVEQGPLLLVVEDVQWADAGSLFLIRHLIRRSRSVRLKLLAVLTYREAEAADACCLQDFLLEVNRERLAAHVKVGRYNRAQTEELLRTMFEQDVEPAFLDAIYRETEGNLFFIEEICKTLIEDGQLYRTAGEWHWPDMRELRLPQSVRATVEARVAKLPGSAREALLLAAVIGEEFEYETLRQASEDPGDPLDEDALIGALELAEQAQLIKEVRGAGAEVFAFAHALIPAALRETVSSVRRRRLHRRVLAALEALHPDDFESLAYHAERAGDGVRAREYYTRAAERSLAAYANQEAERYLRSALEMNPGDAERAQMQALLGEALFRQSRYEQAGRLWHETIRFYVAHGDHNQVAYLYARTARAASHWADAVRSLALCREGLVAVEAMVGTGMPPETSGMASLLHETGRAYRFNQLHHAALPYCQQALALSRRLGLIEVQAETLATLGILDCQPAAERQQALTQAVALAESAGLHMTAYRAHDNLADHLRDMGDLRGALSHNQRARELAQRLDMPRWEHHELIRVAEIALDMGDFARVAEAIGAMPELEARITYSPPSNLRSKIVEARLLRSRGELADAARLLTDLRACGHEHNSPPFLAQVDSPFGDLLLEMGRLDEAEQVLREAIALAVPDLPFPRVWPHCLLIAVYLGQARMADAEHVFEEAHQMAGERRSAGDEVMLVWAEARLALANAQWQQADVAFADLTARLTTLGARWHLGRALMEWADMSVLRQDSRRARDLLRQSGAIFNDLHVLYYASMAATRLSALDGS